VRVEDPAGWPWTVRRRWLPWRPRTHRAVAALYIDVDGSNEIGFVIAVLLNIPCLLVLPVLAVEWVLLLGLLPLVVLARAAGVRFVVTARGRRQDGVRVRYEARAPRWGSLRSCAAAAAEIRADGVPHSLGEPHAVLGSTDQDTEALRQKLRDGDEVRVDCEVQGFGVARSRDDWFTGQITAFPGLLSFDHQRGFETISWPLPGSDDVRVALAGPQERAAVGKKVVACYATASGPFRIAVAPALGPLLADMIAAGAEGAPAADPSWVVWRRDGSGAVREIAAAGSRADAEVLAGTLEAKGSRHTFWVAARR